ncbi:MAG TPA: 50S ribosomal protein L17 [Kiritimatiellia bacterium]|nr:50S ribosomal protein L17 [Kiritimatiellia bacterium]HMP35420.1 50S ribosomal protein L17 [Kiritimatiellia bacterium]
MRHRKRTVKLGRTSAHRDAMLANMVCSLITSKRIKTTLPKARVARSLAEKMVTLGKDGSLAARRRAISKLKSTESVKELFSVVAPSFADRKGGYTRILKLGKRASDSSEMALLEFVNYSLPVPKVADEGGVAKKKAKPAKTEEAAKE